MPEYRDSLYTYHWRETLFVGETKQETLLLLSSSFSESNKQSNSIIISWNELSYLLWENSLSISSIIQYHMQTRWSMMNKIFCSHRVLFVLHHIRHEYCTKWVICKGATAAELTEESNATCLQKLQCHLVFYHTQLKNSIYLNSL